MRSAIVFCLLASLASGQQKKQIEPGVTFPLLALTVQGNHRITPEKVIEVSGLKIGQPIVKADFDDARARLMATGAFESVGYEFKASADYKGYDGIFDVVEVDQLYPYRFEELPVPDDVLRKALRQQELILGEQIPATKEVVDRYVAVIQKLTGPGVTVVGKVNNDFPGQMAILFRPNTPRKQIAEVHFTGNSVLPTGLLMRTLGEVAIGTAFTEATMRVLLDSNIRPLYDARGRIRVKFPTIVAKPVLFDPVRTIDGITVTITVDEGPSYSLGAIKFSGVEAGDAEKTANLQARDVANFDEIKAGLDRVVTRYRNRGYLKVAGHVDREIDDKAHAVNVTLVVDPGPRYSMGKLEISGLDINTEPAIRKAWSLQTGAPFDPGYPDSFLNDLRAQGVFENLGKTRAETKIDEKSHVVSVKLYFSAAGPPAKDRRKTGPGRF